MDAIGGYFELELRKGEHFHKDALKLNTARNCFEYILKARGYKRVYMPFYTCEVMYHPLKKLKIDYLHYQINEKFEVEDLPVLNEGEAILYTNYFALKQAYIEQLAEVYGAGLIIDNAQAFYAPRVNGVDTFYSARKFFGVPDGAYLYTDCYLEEPLEQDISWDRVTHLVKRIDVSAEAGYDDFKRAEENLDDCQILLMSNLTQALLSNVDYSAVALKRRQNYMCLDAILGRRNKLRVPLNPEAVPLAYPYYTDDLFLKARLISNRIFIPTYWENVNRICAELSLENELAKHLIALPIDQRDVDLDKILKIIND